MKAAPSVQRVLMGLLLGVLLLFSAREAPAGEIDKDLLDAFHQKSTQNFFVEFGPQADLSAAYAIKDWNARGRYVWDRLVAQAEESQKDLLGYLRGQGFDFASMKAANAVYVKQGTLAAALQIKDLPGVVRVRQEVFLPLPKPVEGDSVPRINNVEWGIADVRAPDVWGAFGTKGEGIVVANIDTGVLYTHAALVNQYRGNLGGSYDHNYNWWDPSSVCSPSTVPCDNNDHGTHVMGTMVGDDGGANQIGVAPGAKWIACKGCESNSCSESALLSCADFILAPWNSSGLNPDPALRPHVVNNSWGGGAPGSDPWYQAKVNAWRASGIFPAFAAGNNGSGCNSLGAPGSYQESFASAAHDAGRTIAYFSSRGPSPFAGPRVKPNLSAPGVSVRSAVSGGGYASFGGTSMASPHTAGAVALLWSAVPSLLGSIEATFDVLEIFSDPSAPAGNCGAPGPGTVPNYTYGHGYLDIFAVVAAASDPAPYLRVNAASVDDAAGCLPNGQLDAGETADVLVELINIGQLDATGVAATLSSSSPYATVVRAGALFTDIPTGSTGASLAPHFAVTVRSDTPPFTAIPFTLDITADGFSGSGQFLLTAGGFSVDPAEPFDWVDPTSGTPLSLPDDGYSTQPIGFSFTYMGNAYDTVNVSSNGFITFNTSGASAYWNVGIPNSQDPNNMIAPFWDDLNPASAGTVHVHWSGTPPDRVFTAAWVGVPQFSSSAGTGTFQVNLHAGTNEIVFQYLDVDFGNAAYDNGASATVGLENADGTAGVQFSYNSPSLSNNMAIRFAPRSCPSAEPCIDEDGDGYGFPASPECLYPHEDCDDADPNVHPGVQEICDDGIDNNCSGLVDCDDPECFGDPACPEPECIDNDGDGYGNPASPACLFPELDCDDTNPNINPGAWEICNDGIDNNCSGLIDCDDPACDGDPACTPAPPWSAMAIGEYASSGTGASRVASSPGLYLLLPLAGVFALRILIRRRRQGEA